VAGAENYEFCTLFDVNYLPRGLVLYRSLARVCPRFRLRVFCMDQESARILRLLDLPHLVVVDLDELERHDPELLAVKTTRTQIEYCWTATPSICSYCLETESDLEGITYLDADLMFFADPAPIFDEMGDDSVLIVPHRYAPRWQAHEATSGTYNVEFMTFRRDARGLEALGWWRDRCIEWCYYRVEDGKLGDQKYLDDWPDRFDGVHVLGHVGGGLAPWNAEQYTIARSNGTVTVDALPLLFYHYHSLKLVSGITPLRRLGIGSDTYEFTPRPLPLVWRQNYPMSERELQLVWEPYMRELGAAILDVRREVRRYDAGFEPVDRRFFARQFGRKPRAALAGVKARAVRSGSAARRRSPRAPRDEWLDPAVAEQMAALAERQLASPGTVAPYRTFVRAVEALLADDSLPAPARLLDFGCGVGHYSELLERSFPRRFLYTGCDAAEPMIAAARRRWPDRSFVVNDLFANELDLRSYDVVVAGALVDVLADWQRALDVLLGPGARFVMLHRQQIVEGGPTHVDVVPGYEGQTTYRAYLARDDLMAVAAGHGYVVVGEFEVDDPVRTFLLRRDTS
jgi:SAM-dependent methyltransferase